MPNALRDDIQSQSENLQQVIDHLYGSENMNLKKACAFLDNAKPVTFIGMTSAAYLCHPAEYYLGKHGRISNVMQASDALYSHLPSLQHANVVINSRSGETIEVVKIAKALRAYQIPFLAITNEPDSTLAKLADVILWVNSRKDELVSINIITAMMTVTLILASEVLGHSQDLEPILKNLPSLVDRSVNKAWAQADDLLKWFRYVNPIYLLHRGASKGAANCGRLVIEEVARRPAIAMEAGEFRQGPIEVVDETFGALVFVPEGIVGELNCHLANDIQQNGGKVYVVGNRILCSSVELIVQFPVPPSASVFHPVLELIPTQILAYKLAETQDLVPGSVRYISKVITTETGIPSENR
jgi:glucosamine--fructose-6-phosphate aminotransferase (isomerizing)